MLLLRRYGGATSARGRSGTFFPEHDDARRITSRNDKKHLADSSHQSDKEANKYF